MISNQSDNYNRCLADFTISLKALGLFVYFSSYAEGTSFTIQEIMKNCKDGRRAIYSALQELIKAGYVYKREEVTKKKGELFTISPPENQKNVPIKANLT